MRLLLWKGVLVKSRQKFWLSVELLVPLILFVILALVRTRDFSHYESKGFPSTGILPMLHSLLCSLSNKCHLSPITGDETEYIHDGTAANESLLIDLIYYSSLQLGRMGENPNEFLRLLDDFTRLVKIIAEVNGTQWQLPEVQQFFDPSFNVTETLENIGLSENVAKVLTRSKITPYFMIHAYNYVNELRSIPPLLLPFEALKTVPFLCNDTIFNSSFILPPKFIRSVVPGEQKHDKQFCNNVWIRDDLNCSSLETALVQQLRPLFTGYILVTPPSPIVKEMIDILNKPLRMISFLRQKLYEYPELSENLQNAFYQSDLRAATMCFLTDRFVTVANESDLEETAVCLTDYQQYFSGVVFMNMSENATKFNPVTIYKIRHPPHWVDSTYYYEDNPQNYFDRNKPFRDLKYLTYGFSYLQESIDQAITALRTNSSLHLGLYAQQEPYPCVTIDTFNITAFFALFIVLSFIIPASLLVKNIVYEKELRLKFGEILPNVDVSAVFVFLLLFAISSIAMCLFLSTFFSNANISTAATCLIYFLFLFPYQLSIRARNETFSKFTTALGYGAAMIATYNDLDKTTGSIYNIYLTAYNVSMIDCMVAFVVQAIVFMIFAWYKSAVSPGIYGISLPWYFFLTKRYWFPGVVDVTDFSPASNFELASPNAMFEDEPSDSTLAVIISGISKIYNSSGTKALDNLNLCLYEDQITALLGHNGAGKTTTMSILCGLYSPSSGTASIYGMDIRTEIQRVRDVLGVCPQYNVLFWHLTVAEQLRLFAALKGTPDSRLEQEVEEILNAVSLVDKANELAGTLSGGMKRRLCIGIALIGGSRFVILDEPTAGVDVISRKEIWTLLQNNKKGRTILLSTHHMDEADILSDRIAILSEGRLISLGSSVFLKNKYGESFQVIACKKDRAYDYTFIVTSITTEAMIAIRLVDETEDELVFSVPISTDSMELERFFADFDCKKDEYRIAEYGISAPTLQEIFVRLSPQREYVVPVQKSGILSTIKKKMRRELMPVPLYGWELWFNHIKAILVCRYRYTIRSKKQLLFEYAGSPAITQLPLPLIEEIYGNNTFGYISLWDRNPRSLSNQVMHSLLEPPDMGTRCVNDVPIFKRQIALGCDRTAGKATFNWNVNRSTIPYNQYTFHCGCQASWNCTAKNYPFGRIPRIRMNTTMALWDMSYRNISQMRMVSRWTEDGLSNILGGLSLGHISARARSPSQIQSEIEGWQIFVSGINRTAANLNVNVTGIDAPSIYDPFLKNMTTLDFISSVLYSMETKENIKAWFNNKMHASLPILTSFLSNALLRVKSKGLDPNNLGIITISHPMNTTVQDTVDSEASKKLVAFRIVLIMLVLCVIPAGFTVFLVEERVCDAFHLQLVSGLSKFTYWMTSYIFDMDPTLNTPHVICSTVFLVLPQYNLGMAIYRGSFVFQLVQIGENFLLELNREDLLSSLPIPAVLQWSLMGIHCACLIIHSIVAAIMLFIIEQEPFGFLRRKEQNYTKRLVEGVEDTSDDDVILERKRVNDIDDASDIPLIIKNLAKAYSKDSLAVRSISFAVSEGECFGLLGLNGAGKTTTFSILTQKILPGCGSVLIHGRRMVHGSRSNFEQVGYCPQFDALNMKLTTMENIELFARIRGVPENHIGSLVRRLLVSLHLQPYSSTITSELSGGNRRKLSVAIALINHPSLILLDEPSAGMDPSSQQFLWKVIDRLRKSRKSIVITSHSMEECEALCTRIAIMDRGQIRCIGSKQHLKTKFGEGHSLTVKMRSQSDTQLAAEFVVAHLEGAKIESVHCSTLFVHIDREVSSISGIYKVVNRLKEEFSVEDFSLSQSTLAEVFHSLATKNSSISSASSSHASSRNQTDLTEK
ncbi:ABC transporter, ATP-binding protein [Dictyocaulus viviparus]|uniref:ABC transporter, ATP-binding protein n=1 Tax=Dictyocaulus viviparus TaxID=29172 RepID=A0A0D8Y907_DICVI|nr:ABC transporter, ATP-binding protein [Dictyocaulus viviparus]